MSIATFAGDTARPDRILRFEDLLINAGAVPLPIELTPSLLAQTVAADGAMSPANPDPHASSADQMPAQPPDQPAANAEHGKSGAETAADPLLKSLQAALDAIHDSLSQELPKDVSDASENADHSMGASVPGLDASNIAGALAHAAEGQPVATSLGEAGALHDLHASPLANFDLANVVSGLLADHGPDADVVGHVAGPLIGDALSDVGKAANAASNLFHQAQPALSDLAAAVHEVASPAAPAFANAATAPSAAPAAAEAVTVPSLHGAGLDALTGLLQSATPAASDAAHAAGAAPATFEDISMHTPIGLDEIVHHDAAASNAAHAAMPSAGSGLI